MTMIGDEHIEHSLKERGTCPWHPLALCSALSFVNRVGSKARVRMNEQTQECALVGGDQKTAEGRKWQAIC